MLKKLIIMTPLMLMGLSAGINTKASLGRQTGPIDVIDVLPSDRNLCGAADITPDTEKAITEYMRTHYPDEYRKMQIPPMLGKLYDVGDLETFWVLKDSETEDDPTRVEITAKLLAQGDHSAIWADTTVLSSANNISESLAQQYLTLLETKTPTFSIDSTKGVWDIELEYFGTPPNKDGDGVVDYLFADLYSGVAGYFTSLDQTDQTGSNQRDIVYLDIGSSVAYTEATLSHELQHLIHYNYDDHEAVQFNEGLSEVATILCGGSYISHAYYLHDPSISWNWVSDIEHYSMASLFTVYYMEQFGLSVLKEFISLKSGSNALKGFTAFNQLLADKGMSITIQDYFKDWYIANFVNDKTVNLKYGYELSMPMRAEPKVKYLLSTQTVNDNAITGFSANYIQYSSSADSMEIRFSGKNMTKPQYVALEFTDNSTTITEFDDGENYLVKHATKKVRKAVFLVANTQSLNLIYDFTSIGKDISEYSAYDEIAYDDGIPDIFTYDGDSFGWLGWGGGSGSIGKGWAMRFEPSMPKNQLVEFKIMAGFAQEFSGSTTPANADKDFEIHVWKPIGNEGSVTDVITPFIYSTDRSEIISEFMTVDLAPYADQLKNHAVLYVGIVEDDTIGTFLAMDENADGQTYTYAWNSGGNDKMKSLGNFSVGENGASLDGWNYMMRATFLYSDTTAPVFSAGFFQNPVFTDELDLFVLGSSYVSPAKITATATNGSKSVVLTSAVLPGNDSILVAHNYRLNSSGTLDLNVKGSLRYGTQEVDTTFTFNVNYTLARIGGDLIIDNGNFRLTLPAGALAEDIYLITYAGNSMVTNQKIEASLPDNSGPIYTVSPVRHHLQKPSVVTLTIPDYLINVNPTSLVIGYWDGAVWHELPTRVTGAGKQLEGTALNLGQFVVMPKGSGQLLAVEDISLPTEYSLHQNYPNPFNPETSIHFELPEGGAVRLTVYNILGQEVVVLDEGFRSPGRYSVVWNGKNRAGVSVVSGIYFYQLRSKEYQKTRKMILAR